MNIYLVGGAVRDKLLNFPWHESDWVVVGATPEQMAAEGYIAVGKDFPVFLHPKTKEEYALARTERKTAPGYKGFTFYTSPDITLEEDLRRRDLTINAIAESPSGELTDPYGGQQDLKNRVLRHVSNAFAEDPVRILRVARFAARYHYLGFTVAPETQTLMSDIVNSGEVDHLVAERVWKELERALTEQNPEVFLSTLSNCGALNKILPELTELAGAPAPWQDLIQVSRQDNTSLARFSAMLCRLDPEVIKPMCERLTAPKEFRELAVATANCLPLYLQPFTPKPQELLHYITALDAFRRSERFQLCLLTCERISQNSVPSHCLQKGLAACQNINL
jgi:tRNA nucleotidyltransferase (CCA-adding enzyme)